MPATARQTGTAEQGGGRGTRRPNSASVFDLGTHHTREAEPSAIEPEIQTRRRKPKRKPLPENLPRDVVEHAPACACPKCGGALRRLGEDVTEVLEYVPGFVPRDPACASENVLPLLREHHPASGPSLPINRGLAGPGLLAHVLVGKFCDHLPLHRQAEIYARDGIDLDRSTLADWVGQCAWLLRPLVDAVGAHVMAAARVYADAAAIYTLTETAKLNRFDPEDYLRKVLERIADHPVRRVHEFLPWNLDGIRQRLDQRDAA